MNKECLAYKLKEYVSSGILPMHMPGHKRKVPKAIEEMMTDIYKMDLTEVEGTDNLHDATGIIRDSMEFAKHVYKSNKTYYLINGSSCGILSSIRACACTGNYKNEKSYIVVAPNAHFSVYNAIELLDLTPIYLDVYYNELDIAESCDIKALKSILRVNIEKNIVAAVITSPTYEGVVSDIEKIAKLLHDEDIPLIVDEAHGGHLNYINNIDYGKSKNKFCVSALDLGADIVVQSLHKTLPALTQTALCHINSEIVSEKYLEESLHIFETSSPSYILMASIDTCIRYMANSDEEIKDYLNNLFEFRRAVKKLKHIRLWEDKNKLGYDFTKLVICCDMFDGVTLAQILRDSYNIETEMSKLDYVLAYSTLCDDKDDFDKLYNALKDIDNNFLYMEKKPLAGLDKKYLGTVAKENIYIYPPGVPVLKKGDIMEKRHFDVLDEYIKKGKKVYGLDL